MKLRPDEDTFVIGYPKSGTTWTSEIVWLLRNNLDFEKARAVKYQNRYPYIADRYYPSLTNFLKSPRVFRSHLLLKDFPRDFAKKVKV
jgi:hypothetical protein